MQALRLFSALKQKKNYHEINFKRENYFLSILQIEALKVSRMNKTFLSLIVFSNFMFSFKPPLKTLLNIIPESYHDSHRNSHNEIFLIYWIILSGLCGFSWICGDNEILRRNKGEQRSFDDVKIFWQKSYSGGIGWRFASNEPTSWLDMFPI